jgi:hypothetical protein
VLTPQDSLEVFGLLTNIVTTLLGNPEYVVERAQKTNRPLADVLSIFNKMNKQVAALYSDIYNPATKTAVAAAPTESKGVVINLDEGITADIF